MPIQTLWTEHGIHWICSGVVPVEEMIDAVIKRFYDDERSMSVRYEIIDCLEVEEMGLGDRDAVFFAASDIGRSRMLRSLKIAFIAVDEKVLHLIRVYISKWEHISHSWEFRIFEDRSAAFEWVQA